MIDYYVIRNRRQLMDLVLNLQERRLPLKVAVDEIYPKRSLDLNAYYWGVVLACAADASGHSIDECHEHFKQKYSYKGVFRFNAEKKQYEWISGVQSTAAQNNKEFCDYVFKVRAEIELDLHTTVPLPNESWVEELRYDYENSHETRRL